MRPPVNRLGTGVDIWNMKNRINDLDILYTDDTEKEVIMLIQAINWIGMHDG